jgi:S1-C subfamily serine protease
VKAISLGLFLSLALVVSRSFGAELSSTNIADLPYEQVRAIFEKDEALEGTRITSYSASSVTVNYKGRYLVFSMDKLSAGQRSRIDQLVALEKEKRQAETAKANEAAARAGMLREVEGVIYNLQKPTADWATFNNVRVLQKTEEGLLVDTTPQNFSSTLIYVRNLPQYDRVADGDYITFMAKQVGSYTYITRARVDKTVRQYDCGTLPGKSKSPSLVRAPTQPKAPGLGTEWDGSGTGFFITEDGYLATCHHVVDEGRVFSVRNPAGTFTAKVIATDKSNDVAILKVTGRFTALAINTNALALGQSAFTIGFPNIDIQGLAPKYTDGKVSSLTGIHDEAGAFQISVPVQPGNSGGPLADAGGNIIGIVVARLNDFSALRRTRSLPQNVNYAVKASALAALVRKAGIESQVSYSTATTPADGAVKLVESATALILVGE